MKKPKTKIFLILGVTQILISCTPNKLEESSQKQIKDKNPQDFNVYKEEDSKKTDVATHTKKKNLDIEIGQQEKATFWEELTKNFLIDREVGRKKVQIHINWYKRNPKHVERVSQRAKPYLPYIVKELKKNGLPLEFALLPFIESAFDLP